MVIDACEPKILEWAGAKRFEQTFSGRGGVFITPRHPFEQCLQLSGVHHDAVSDGSIDLGESPTVI